MTQQDEIGDGSPLPRCLQYLDAFRLEKGGVVRAALDLIEGLLSAGVEVTLVTGDATDLPDDWNSGQRPGLRVVTIDAGVNALLQPKCGPAPLEELVAEVDVVHLHTPWDPFNLAVAKAAKKAGRPYVISIHGMLDEWSMQVRRAKKKLYLALAGRRLLKDAAALHFTAQAERDQGMIWAPAANPVVAPLLMDLSPYAALPGPEPARQRFTELNDPETIKLLFLSRVDPKKGLDLLIDAVAAACQEGLPVKAFLAGPGTDEYINGLTRQAESLGVADHIKFVGMISGEDKWSLYQACDLFVLPTHQENFGIVLIEAMACELPTLTTYRVDIWQELQQHGATIVGNNREGRDSGPKVAARGP